MTRTSLHEPGNPHPMPDERRLSQITDETLRDMIRLRRAAEVADDRFQFAGVPTLSALGAELLRRETAGMAVQR